MRITDQVPGMSLTDKELWRQRYNESGVGVDPPLRPVLEPKTIELDGGYLGQVIDVAGADRACRVCGCTDLDCSGCIERTGEPCTWEEPDLCSACAVGVEAPRRPFTWDETVAAAGKVIVDVADWTNKAIDRLMRWWGLDPTDADLRGRWARGVTSAAPRQHPNYRRAARGTKQWDRKRTARLRRELIAADLKRLDQEALDA